MDKVWLIGTWTAISIITLESLAAELPWQCPPGYVFNRAYNGCRACDNGTFMDKINSEDSCVGCTVCSGGRVTVSPCNSSVNTVCTCPDDYYENSDDCVPKEGGNCSSSLSKIVISIETLWQSLNGTAEQDLLGDVLNEIRMVNICWALASRGANRTSSKRTQVETVVSQLPFGSEAVQFLQTALLVVVLIRPIWQTAKYVFYKLKMIKSLYDKFIKILPQDTAPPSSNYNIFMDHVENSIERVRQSLNSGTTAINLQGVLGDVRSVKNILDSEFNQATTGSPSEPVSQGGNHEDDTARPIAENCTHLLEQIESSVERVRQSLNDQVYADLLRVALIEVRIVKLKVISAHSTESRLIRLFRSLIPQHLNCFGRNWSIVACTAQTSSIDEPGEQLNSTTSDGDARFRPHLMRIGRSWIIQLSRCCCRHRRTVDETNAEGATRGESAMASAVSITDEVQITTAVKTTENSAAESALSGAESAVTLSKSVSEFETQIGGNAKQSDEADNATDEQTSGIAGGKIGATLATSTADSQSASTGMETSATLAGSTAYRAQIATTGGEIAATVAPSNTSDAPLVKTRGTVKASTMETLSC